MIHQISFWLNNSRKTALPQSMLPAILSVCMAMQSEYFSWMLAVLAVVGVAFVHLGSNLLDDYFDYRKNKNEIHNQSLQPDSAIRMGKCNYIISQQTSLKKLLFVICLFFLLALICGFFIFLERGIIIFYFVLIGAFLSVSYSGFPFRFSYHGLGELVIGFIFGPLLMIGVFYSASGEITSSIKIISIVVGFFVSNILYTHSVMDYKHDEKVKKKTLAVLLNNKKAMLCVSLFLIFSPYVLIIWGVYAYYLSMYYIFVLFTFPMAIGLFYLLWQYVKNPQRKFSPRFWMGPMEKWEAIQKAGIDQFMIRWFLARNLTTLFCLIAAVVSFF
jgi:1,4-dihydroxy-2-naphthoate polyprenyltransferase